MGKSVIGSGLLYASTIKASATAVIGGEVDSIHNLYAGEAFSSVTYRSVFGEPLLLSLIALEDISALEHVTTAANKALKALPEDSLAEDEEAVSGGLIRFLAQASHPATPPQDAPYLMYVRAELAPLENVGYGRDILYKMASQNALGVADYTYESVDDSPTWNWFASFDSFAALEKIGDPLSKVKAKAGSNLVQSFAPLADSISTIFLRKVA